jgi:hypothetical protein
MALRNWQQLFLAPTNSLGNKPLLLTSFLQLADDKSELLA